jgi:hypothetical protein
MPADKRLTVDLFDAERSPEYQSISYNWETKRNARAGHMDRAGVGGQRIRLRKLHLKPAGLRFINADVMAGEFDMEPYRKVAVFEDGRRIFVAKPVPKWLRRILKDTSGT